MHFIIFVEGDTEERVLASFLKKWLNQKLSQPVGIRTVNFKGYANLCKDAAQKAAMHLKGPRSDEIIAVIGLLDLYGPSFYPEKLRVVDEKYQWAKKHLEEQVGSERYRQHFAVHELEAWLLSNPALFSPKLSTELKAVAESPETVNCERPPAKFLEELYYEKLNKSYKKVTEGNRLFSRLDPETVREKCPYFKLFTDDIYNMAMKHISKTNK